MPLPLSQIGSIRRLDAQAHATTSPDRDLSVLHRWLTDSQSFGPSYQGEMSNHLPMVLHSAWELGADALRLQAQFEQDAPKLEPATSAPPCVPQTVHGPQGWLSLRGQTDAYSALRTWFECALARQTPEAVVRAALPGLLPGMHALAFHGLIRTAHAWESGHPGELASALATWAAWWEALPPGEAIEPSGRLTPATWGGLLRERSLGWCSTQPMIVGRMRDAARTPIYAGLAERLSPAASVTAQRSLLLDFACQAYLHSRNFTLLHMITALRALRVVLPLVGPMDGEEDLALQSVLARATVAAWMAGNVQWVIEASMAPARPWSNLIHLALAQFDDHAIKLVHACWQEDRLQPDTQWRAVASRVLAVEG